MGERRGDRRLQADRDGGRPGSAVVEDRAPQFALDRVAAAGAYSAAPAPAPGPCGGNTKAVRATRGGILVAGRAYSEPGTGPSDWVLARYTIGGRLLGVARTDFGTGEDEAFAIALTPGHATLAGSIYGSHGLARYSRANPGSALTRGRANPGVALTPGSR